MTIDDAMRCDGLGADRVGEDCPRCGKRAEHCLGTTHEGATQWRCEDCRLPFMVFPDIGEEPGGAEPSREDYERVSDTYAELRKPPGPIPFH